MTYRKIENIFKRHYEHGGILEKFQYSDCKVSIIEDIVKLFNKEKKKAGEHELKKKVRKGVTKK